jgi:hypothetical protein
MREELNIGVRGLEHTDNNRFGFLASSAVREIVTTLQPLFLFRGWHRRVLQPCSDMAAADQIITRLCQDMQGYD